MTPAPKIPQWPLYAEQTPLPDILHIERFAGRAADHDWQIAPHRHAQLHQVFLLTSGTAQEQINGERIAAIRPQVMNMPRGHAHGFQVSAGTEGYVLTLPAADFSDLFGQQSETKSILELPFLINALPDYARTLGLSERRLRRLCQDHTGMSATAIVGVSPNQNRQHFDRSRPLKIAQAQGYKIFIYNTLGQIPAPETVPRLQSAISISQMRPPEIIAKIAKPWVHGYCAI